MSIQETIADGDNPNDRAMEKAGREMEALFDGFFSSIEGLRQNTALPENQNVDSTIASVSSNLWTPKITKHESESSITLVAHLPNVPSNQIRIDTDTPGRLKIYSESNNQVVYESDGDRVTECRLGQFEKDIPLPLSACVERTTAIFHGSDVVITVPKY
ncbi:hypothetical protein BX070DRAFT_251719 [Coemansia spiralis]|nr:hypothetical protein BX070DRAFT_251719 [Coemansia spiralis]